MANKVLDFLGFGSMDDFAVPKDRWALNMSVTFCIFITVITTSWFYEYNSNIARDGAPDLTPSEWVGVNAVMYFISLWPLAFVLLVEKILFRNEVMPLLGLKPTPNAVKSKKVIIALFLSAAIIKLGIRLLLQGGREVDFTPLLIAIPNNVVIVPCEEIVYRGYVQSTMIRRFGDLPGILITAILFLMVHFPVRILIQSDTVTQLVFKLAVTLVGGLFFGVFARKDQCIYGSAVLHYALNVCVCIGLL